MDGEKALGILKALAEGVDPRTGESFGDDSPYQQADTVRALYVAVQALQGGTAKAKPAARGNAGKPWTPEEDQALLAAFDAGQRPEDLARQHSRSKLGIEARLAKFGKLPPPAQTLPSTRMNSVPGQVRGSVDGRVREPQSAYAR